ncbi:hypothetical protein SELMODRAFT_411941 [Selaginella moellendorffii]|uniref:Plant heme peroxidase family profile domain-containing protein n=1 Tax=Selaginella moellendorffii TaxID=88036 RepID=D8RJI6_SELML|nr:hypothetical protein SELMODRAFT_411941 [Selaginella moellendorffii]
MARLNLAIISLVFLGTVLGSRGQYEYDDDNVVAISENSTLYGLSEDFYRHACPQVYSIVRAGVEAAIKIQQRNAASLLRLFFHDCFVQGCDASLLLDDAPFFIGEKTAAANNQSARGFEFIDVIKASVEEACPLTVSCADILAIVARDAVVLSGGPNWEVALGRRDSLTASRAASDHFIPDPTYDLPQLLSSFQAMGLGAEDLVSLVGAHTMGFSRCTSFEQRIYNQSGTHHPDLNIEPGFLKQLHDRCPPHGDPNTLQPLDWESPASFDNGYYKNLVSQSAVLHSDGTLYSEAIAGFAGIRELVEKFAEDEQAFFASFARSIVRMGNLRPLIGDKGEIGHCDLLNCLLPRSPSSRNLVYYIHGIRVPANSSQRPFPNGYGEVFRNKITESYEYDSRQIGVYQGSYPTVRDGSVVSLRGTISLATSDGVRARFNVRGPYDFSQLTSIMPISGTLGGRSFLGIQNATVLFAYGRNGVVKGQAKICV